MLACQQRLTASAQFREAKDGAAEGIRTPDPRITNAVLYRLSYRGGRMPPY